MSRYSYPQERHHLSAGEVGNLCTPHTLQSLQLSACGAVGWLVDILKCSIWYMTFFAQSPYTKFCTIQLYSVFFMNHLGFCIILLIVMSLSLALHNQANPLQLMYRSCVLGLTSTSDLSWVEVSGHNKYIIHVLWNVVVYLCPWNHILQPGSSPWCESVSISFFPLCHIYHWNVTFCLLLLSLSGYEVGWCVLVDYIVNAYCVWLA